MNANSASVDPADLERFERLGSSWWDPRGPMKPLHQINPLRLRYVIEHLARTGDRPAPLENLSVLDIGCGGGLFSEALAGEGARVTGIDPSEGVIGVAQAHAGKSGLVIDYRAQTAESHAESGAQYDVVCAMEVVEHVVEMPAFVATACRMVRPGGWFFTATLNRTLKSFALAIVGAEYVLRWVPQDAAVAERMAIVVCAQLAPARALAVEYVGDCKAALRLVIGVALLRGVDQRNLGYARAMDQFPIGSRWCGLDQGSSSRGRGGHPAGSRGHLGPC